MRWKRVAWAGCLVPAVGGCSVGVHAARDAAAETRAAHAGRGVDRAIRQAAREAWAAVVAEHSRRAFCAEFRDGFLDGYADYLDRGGDGSPPAAPPVRYATNPKYLTPEGHALIRQYFLGFRYGADVAIASGRRHYFTVPVLIPDDSGPPVEVVPAPAPDPAAPVATAPPPPKDADPLPAPRKVPPGLLPEAQLPGWATAPAPAPTLWPATKPDPRPHLKSDAPAAKPAKPPAVPEVGPSKFVSHPIGVEPDGPSPVLPPPLPVVPAPPDRVPVGVKLPPPPAEVPTLPDRGGLPILDPLPAVPPNTAESVPVPAYRPDPGK